MAKPRSRIPRYLFHDEVHVDILTGLQLGPAICDAAGVPLEARLWDYIRGANPFRLRTRVHGCLLRMFYLHRQVLSDMGFHAPKVGDFCSMVCRSPHEIAEILLGQHPVPSMYGVGLARQWTQFLGVGWKQLAEREKKPRPHLWLNMDGDGDIWPYCECPRGTGMCDPILRERQERWRPDYPQWGFAETEAHYLRLIDQCVLVDMARVGQNIPTEDKKWPKELVNLRAEHIALRKEEKRDPIFPPLFPNTSRSSGNKS